jgi:hypothetical protein
VFNANISNISAIPWREQILYIRHLHIGTRIRRTGEKSQEALGLGESNCNPAKKKYLQKTVWSKNL